MKLFKLYKECTEADFNVLITRAATGDRITLFHNKDMPDEYIASTRGVIVQCGKRIFLNDDPTPLFSGTYQKVWDHAETPIILKMVGSNFHICQVRSKDAICILSVPIACGFVHVESFLSVELFVQYGNVLTMVGAEVPLYEKPVDAWAINWDGCIVQIRGRLWRIATPGTLNPYSEVTGVKIWQPYNNGVTMAARGQGLIRFDGKTTVLLAPRPPKEWCTTATGKVIKLENNAFVTLDDELVYDGPFYAWKPHPYGVLIERDGDLVLAVVK